MSSQQNDPRAGTVAVVGSGVAGLITAYTLLRDGFNVQVLTRDSEAGGVWSKDRIYPGLFLNKYVSLELILLLFISLSTLHSVHGEYRLSPMNMPPLVQRSDARIGGEDMCAYTTAFASKFLEGKIQYDMDVRRIRRNQSGPGWQIDIVHRDTAVQETRLYDRLVLCTGVRLRSAFRQFHAHSFSGLQHWLCPRFSQLDRCCLHWVPWHGVPQR